MTGSKRPGCTSAVREDCQYEVTAARPANVMIIRKSMVLLFVAGKVLYDSRHNLTRNGVEADDQQ
jgi:hypothetical protein